MLTSLHIISAVGGLALGIASAWLNSHITKKRIYKDEMGAIAATNGLRMVIDIATMAVAYFAATLFALPLLITLIGTAVGLTVFGTVFLVRITKAEKSGTPKKQDGGE